MRLGIEYRIRESDLYSNEKSQTLVRLGICFFMAIYFFATGFTNHPLYIFFISYCLFQFALVRISPKYSRQRIIASIFIDNFCTVAGLHITGEQGTFLFILLIQISLGNGLRYGRTYLWLSVFLACIGITTLYLSPTPWEGHVHLALAYLLGTPFIAYYIDYLVRELHTSKLAAEKRASDVTDLLAFVAHDVRTPLHALLTTASVARIDALDDLTRSRLTRIESGIRALARLTTDVLGASKMGSSASDGRAHSIPICAWIVDVSKRFADEIEISNAKLIYDFDYGIAPIVDFDTLTAERLLLNALSNAVRHSKGTEIRISLETRPLAENAYAFRLTVRNQVGEQTGGQIASDEYANPNEKYHGSGIGLLVAKELALSANGRFEFFQTDSDDYVAIIDLPFSVPPHVPPVQVLYPVIVVSRHRGLIRRIKNLISASTNVVVFETTESLHEARGRVDAPASAVLVDSTESDGFGESRKVLQEYPKPVWPNAVASQRNPRLTMLEGENFPVTALSEDTDQNAILNVVFFQSAIRECANALDFAPSSAAENSLHGKSVLVVDDNHTNLELMAESLRRVSAAYRCADSNDSAFKAIDSFQFDAILVDWNLGSSTAAAIIDSIRLSSRQKNAKVFIFSSESESRIRELIGSRMDLEILERPLAAIEVLNTVSARLGADEGEPWSIRALRGDRLFDISMYEELLCQGTTELRIDGLLKQFKDEAEQILNQINAGLDDGERGSFAPLIHALKSVCLAAGAYELGNSLPAQTGQSSEDGDGVESFASRALVRRSEYIWRLTVAHVDWFRASISAKCSIQERGS